MQDSALLIDYALIATFVLIGHFLKDHLESVYLRKILGD